MPGTRLCLTSCITFAIYSAFDERVELYALAILSSTREVFQGPLAVVPRNALKAVVFPFTFLPPVTSASASPIQSPRGTKSRRLRSVDLR